MAIQAWETEAQAIQFMEQTMEEEAFEQAVCLLSQAERIGTSGCGHSGIACQHMAHLMCCIDRPARFLSPSEAVHGAMGFLQKDDVLLLASRGGKTEELMPLLSVAKGKGVIVLTVTENRSSPLAAEADLVLPIRVLREADPYNTQGTTSFLVMNALFDALQAAIIEKISYPKENFVINHPGGAVGKQLRVSHGIEGKGK